MNRFVRTLLLWILMLALPMQGAVASTMRTCAASPAAAVSNQDATATAMDPHAGHHGMHAANSTSAEHAGMAHAGDGSHHPHAKHSSMSCSTCAVCCVGAAAAPVVLQWTPTIRANDAPMVAVTSLFSGYIPSGLERPPRLFA